MKVMTKPKIMIFGVVLVLILGACDERKNPQPLWAAAGQSHPDASNAGAKAGKEALPGLKELKEKLWQAAEAKERKARLFMPPPPGQPADQEGGSRGRGCSS